MTGTLRAHYLEEEAGEGRWPHYIIELETDNQVARAVINFKSRYRQELQFRLLEHVNPESFLDIHNAGHGFHPLAKNSRSGAIDYLRHPDLLSRPGDWLQDDAIDAEAYLDQALNSGDEVMVYGHSFGAGEGMHRVHMEQGDPLSSSFSRSNKPWQDGALFYWHEKDGETQLAAFLVKFTRQSFCTNGKGKALPCR